MCSTGTSNTGKLDKIYIDGPDVSAMCRLGGKSSEMVKHGIPTGNKWCVHNVVTAADDGKVTLYRDKPIKTDRKVSYNKPDVAVIDRGENTWCIVDFAIPMDHNAQEKEVEKTDKYMHLEAEVRRKFMVKTVIVPIVLGAFGTVPAKLLKSLK